jgi:hypothetical protein
MIDILTQKIMTLNNHEREQLFGMLSNNAALLIKLIPDAPLLNYIITGHTTSNSEIIQAYNAWKNKN